MKKNISNTTVTINGKQVPIKNSQEASKLFRKHITTDPIIRAMGSNFIKRNDGNIHQNGKLVGYVSQNGRVWKGNPKNWEKNKEWNF